MKKIYTFGYQGQNQALLSDALKEINGVLVDVRLAARSRVPAWNKSHLHELLKDRYVHIRNLGNLNYKNDGPVEIVDLETGLQEVLLLAKRRSVVLTCVCKNLCGCHRETISNALRERGIETEEFVIEKPSSTRTMDLFDALDEIERQQSNV